jgi:hypothetical protein
MAEWNPMVKTGQRSSHDRRGVTLSQNHIRMFSQQHIVQPGQEPCRQRCQCLIWAHDVEIDIGLDIEDLHDLVEHVAMLGCSQNATTNFRTIPQC